MYSVDSMSLLLCIIRAKINVHAIALLNPWVFAIVFIIMMYPLLLPTGNVSGQGRVLYSHPEQMSVLFQSVCQME